MQTIWKPEGKHSRILLRQILNMRDRGLLTVWTEQDENGNWIYVINTEGDRQ